MKKLTIYTEDDVDIANEVAIALKNSGYDCFVSAGDIAKSMSDSNNRWDDVFINLKSSQNSINSVYFWGKGTEEQKLATNIAKATNAHINMLPDNDFMSKSVDAVSCKVSITDKLNAINVANGIINYFKE